MLVSMTSFLSHVKKEKEGGFKPTMVQALWNLMCHYLIKLLDKIFGI